MTTCVYIHTKHKHMYSNRLMIFKYCQLCHVVYYEFMIETQDKLIMELVLEEIIENLGCLSRSVVRLSKRCVDPVYHRLEQFYVDPVHNDFQWFGWAYINGRKWTGK